MLGVAKTMSQKCQCSSSRGSITDADSDFQHFDFSGVYSNSPEVSGASVANALGDTPMIPARGSITQMDLDFQDLDFSSVYSDTPIIPKAVGSRPRTLMVILL